MTASKAVIPSDVHARKGYAALTGWHASATTTHGRISGWSNESGRRRPRQRRQRGRLRKGRKEGDGDAPGRTKLSIVAGFRSGPAGRRRGAGALRRREAEPARCFMACPHRRCALRGGSCATAQAASGA